MKKEQERLKKELARSKGMLSNEKFLSKAPEAKSIRGKRKTCKIRADDAAGRRTSVTDEIE